MSSITQSDWTSDECFVMPFDFVLKETPGDEGEDNPPPPPPVDGGPPPGTKNWTTDGPGRAGENSQYLHRNLRLVISHVRNETMYPHSTTIVFDVLPLNFGVRNEAIHFDEDFSVSLESNLENFGVIWISQEATSPFKDTNFVRSFGHPVATSGVATGEDPSPFILDTQTPEPRSSSRLGGEIPFLELRRSRDFQRGGHPQTSPVRSLIVSFMGVLMDMESRTDGGSPRAEAAPQIPIENLRGTLRIVLQ